VVSEVELVATEEYIDDQQTSSVMPPMLSMRAVFMLAWMIQSGSATSKANLEPLEQFLQRSRSHDPEARPRRGSGAQ
jgi:hypothetical protein